MKIGMICCKHFEKLNLIQDEVVSLVKLGEDITIITLLKNNSDSVAIVGAGKLGFKVNNVETVEEVFTKSDGVVFFHEAECEHCKDIIKKAKDSLINFKAIA